MAQAFFDRLTPILPSAVAHQWGSGGFAFTTRSRTFYNMFSVAAPRFRRTRPCSQGSAGQVGLRGASQYPPKPTYT
eukprot:41489-Lingulodinium_polyedra.AAC.1